MAVARLRKENQVDNTLLGDQDSGLSFVLVLPAIKEYVQYVV